MKTNYYLILVFLIFTISCDGQVSKRNRYSATEKNENNTGVPGKLGTSEENRRISKAVYYLENSESMCGYVNGYTGFVNAVSELAFKQKFIDQKTLRHFFFVNGRELNINFLGTNPEILTSKLTVAEYRKYGDIRFSNLNSMFQLALETASKDTIALLITDAIFDVGKISPQTALAVEGKVTRSKFIKRLGTGDVQTIVIKLTSRFTGSYFPVLGGIIPLEDQDRPYYVWIFGESELLNEYFPEDYIKSLNGFSDVARFLKLSDLNVPYQAVPHEIIGDFKFDKNNKNKLTNVKTDKYGKGFQFTIAVNFSSLPFSDSYLSSTSNYSANNSNYSITNVSKIGDVKLFGLNFTPTHLITVYTSKSPFSQLDISLLNRVPEWIENTNSDDESNIKEDTTHTYGFKHLINGIVEAYQYKNPEDNIVTLKFDLIK